MSKSNNFRVDDNILRENETNANNSICTGLFITAFILILIWIGYLTKIFILVSYTAVNIVFPISIVLLLLFGVLRKTKLTSKPRFKYYVLIVFIFVLVILNIFLPKHAMIGWAACIVIACHYYSPKLLTKVFIIVSVLMLGCIYAGMFLGEWDCNLMNGAGYTMIDGYLIKVDYLNISQRVKYLSNLCAAGDNRLLKAFIYYFTGRFACLLVVFIIARRLSTRTLLLLTKESINIKNNEKMISELNIAKNIQVSVLPTTFPDNQLFGLHAIMHPAKEVGGDFYDYFYIEEGIIAIVVADVSGKGVPAAMFMMKAESTIKSLALSLSLDTASILARTNLTLSEENSEEMFVTCWLGILDVSTGILKYTNAGHNPPILVHEGEVKEIKSKPQLPLGVFTSTTYVCEKLKLTKGDKILLYTDGVTEAHNGFNQLYGEKRLLSFVAKYNFCDPKSFTDKLLTDIHEFANKTPQFDDITILSFEYRKKDYEFEDSIEIIASDASLAKVLDFVDNVVNKCGGTPKLSLQLQTAIEEAFVNVAHYAYKDNKDGLAYLKAILDNEYLTFVLVDKGIPFNPLLKEDPDITLSEDQRNIGGLGIFMVKNIMDKVSYNYFGTANVLTMIKKIK